MIFTVIATTAPATEGDLVTTLRTYTIPQATSGTGVDAFVGGQTASYVDLANEISSRLMLVILAVIALSFVVLLTAFRSLVVAAQAAVANVLSVAAAFGVHSGLSMGLGLSLVGLDTASGTDPIASYVPLMMFAVLFGLSMDYQVFLISQIEHHRARPPKTPVRRWPADSRQCAGDRRRRADHDVRLRELHPQRRSDREAVRGRALGRRCACRHDRAPARAGAVGASRCGSWWIRAGSIAHSRIDIEGAAARPARTEVPEVPPAPAEP